MLEQSTSSVQFFNGIPCTVPNKIVKSHEKYYISYNNSCVSDYGCNTTALVIESTSQFLILNDNHTEELNRCKTLEECLKYFYKNISQANPLSEHGKVFKFSEELGARYEEGGF